MQAGGAMSSQTLRLPISRRGPGSDQKGHPWSSLGTKGAIKETIWPLFPEMKDLEGQVNPGAAQRQTPASVWGTQEPVLCPLPGPVFSPHPLSPLATCKAANELGGAGF